MRIGEHDEEFQTNSCELKNLDKRMSGRISGTSSFFSELSGATNSTIGSDQIDYVNFRPNRATEWDSTPSDYFTRVFSSSSQCVTIVRLGCSVGPAACAFLIIRNFLPSADTSFMKEKKFTSSNSGCGLPYVKVDPESCTATAMIFGGLSGAT